MLLPVTRIVQSLMHNNTTSSAHGHSAGAGGAAGSAASSGDPARSFLYLDPRVGSTLPDGQAPLETRVRGAFRSVVVLMLGGGTCAEYVNLQELAAAANAGHGGAGAGHGGGLGLGAVPGSVTSIAYAASEMLSPEEFIGVLADLGKERPAAVGALELMAAQENVTS